MRYESPLNADAFRRNSISEEEEALASRARTPEQRTTIRPLIGSAIGTIGVRRVSTKVYLGVYFCSKKAKEETLLYGMSLLFVHRSRKNDMLSDLANRVHLNERLDVGETTTL